MSNFIALVSSATTFCYEQDDSVTLNGGPLLGSNAINVGKKGEVLVVTPAHWNYSHFTGGYTNGIEEAQAYACKMLK